MSAIAIVKQPGLNYYAYILTTDDKSHLLRKYAEVPYYKNIGPIAKLVHFVIGHTYTHTDINKQCLNDMITHFSQTVDTYKNRDPHMESITWFYSWQIRGYRFSLNTGGLNLLDIPMVYSGLSIIAHRQWNYITTPVLANNLIITSLKRPFAEQVSYVDYELSEIKARMSNYQYAYVSWCGFDLYYSLGIVSNIFMNSDFHNIIYVAFTNNPLPINVDWNLDKCVSYEEKIKEITIQLGVPIYHLPGDQFHPTIDFF